MYTLGIPKRDYRRASQVLDYESQPPIPFNETLQDDGFYVFTFPECGDEDNFRHIVNKLKNNGIRVIGADAQLTERQIMKLANLIEAPLESFDEDEMSEKDVISQIKKVLSSDEADPTSKFWNKIADIIGDYEDQDEPPHKQKVYENKKDKVRKVIRKLIRQ